MPLIRGTHCFFLHIPRCGGTSIHDCFGFADKSLQGVVRDGNDWITLHHLTPTELICRGFLSREALSAQHVFTTIRDPFDRLVSDYCWQRRHDRHGIFSGMTFAEYLDFAEEVMTQSRYFEEVHFDHFRPMHEYLYHDGELVVDSILLLADIDRELHRLPMAVGKSTLPRCNSYLDDEVQEQALSLRSRVYDCYQRDLELFESVTASRESEGSQNLQSSWV